MESKLRFKNPILQNMSFSINENYENSSPVLTIKNVFNSKVTTYPNKNKAKVVLNFHIDIQDENPPFSLSASIFSIFEWDEATNEEVNVFLTQSAPSLLLGYLRPIIHNVTVSSMRDGYNIPFMNFTQGVQTEFNTGE